jgi:hypothetical protein
MAMVDTEMAKIEEIFLPYINCGDKTYFEKIESERFVAITG